MFRNTTLRNDEGAQSNFVENVVYQAQHRALDTVQLSPRPLQPASDPWIGGNTPLVLKLGALVQLGRDEINVLEALSLQAKSMQPEQILVHEGEPADWIYIIVSGLACRYKMLAGGRRQVLGYLIPGDLCDFNFILANRPDYSVAVVGKAQVARIPVRKFRDLTERYPSICHASTLATVIDSVIMREWLLSIGQRDAVQRLCHLFCELAERFEAIGQLDEDGGFDMPVNQVTLADTLGLTPVHINRTLQRLRSEGLIRLCQRRLAILDRARLASVAGYDGNYLRLLLNRD